MDGRGGEQEFVRRGTLGKEEGGGLCVSRERGRRQVEGGEKGKKG